MTTRVRWMTARLGAKLLRACVQRIQDEEYFDGMASGFRVWTTRKEFLEAAFVERFDVKEQVEDPFGRSIAFPVVEFRTTRFVLSLEEPGLEIVNPGRGVRSLVTRLGEFSAFTAPITPISVDVIGWLNAVEEILGKMTIRRIKASNIQLGEDAAGSVEVESVGDARARLKELIGKRRCVVDSVVAEKSQGEEGVKLQLVRNGTAVLSGVSINEALSHVRSSLVRGVVSEGQLG